MTLDFEVIQDSDGEFAAACYQEQIYVEGQTLEGLCDNLQAAIRQRQKIGQLPEISPEDIRLIVFRHIEPEYAIECC